MTTLILGQILGHTSLKFTLHKGLMGGSRLATKIFQIMLLNEAETSTELNSGIYGSWTFHFDCPIGLVLQIATLKAWKISILKVFLYHAPETFLLRFK